MKIFILFLVLYFVVFMVITTIAGQPFDAVRNLLLSLIVAAIATAAVKAVAMSSHLSICRSCFFIWPIIA